MRAEVTGDRLLAVVAHPDDETFGCGSILLHAAARGAVTAVLCATRGEAGEATDGTPPHVLGVAREAETRAAAEVLGVGRVDFLDLLDSGMSGEVGAGTLVGAPFDDVVGQIRAHIEEFRPTAVLTLDAADGHRDHARIRDATLEAVDTAQWRTGTVDLQCLPKSLMQKWVDHMAQNDPSWEHLRLNMPGTPDELVTQVLDTTEFYADRERAIRMHASQRSPFDGLPDELRRAFLTSEHLQRVRPA